MLRILSVGITGKLYGVRVGDRLLRAEKLPTDCDVRGSSVRVIVYAKGSSVFIVGDCWIDSSLSFVQIRDSDGKARGTLEYKCTVPSVSEPAQIQPKRRDLFWVPTIGLQMYPSFVLDNQKPSSSHRREFFEYLDSTMHHLAPAVLCTDGWRPMQAFLLLVTDFATSAPFVEDSVTGVEEQSSNLLWSADIPRFGGDCEDKVRCTLGMWYALRSLYPSIPKRHPMKILARLARKLMMFAAHCTQFGTDQRHLAIVVCSRAYARSGGTIRAPVLDGCEWDGSMRLVEGTVRCRTWYDHIPKDVYDHEYTEVSMQEVLRGTDVRTIEFLHCIATPTVRYTITPLRFKCMSHMSENQARIVATEYADGTWCQLPPLPDILPPK